MSRTLRLFAMLTLAFAAACGDDDPTGPVGSVPGTYELISVNGDTPPTTLLQTPELKWEILGGDLSFATNGRYTATHDFRDTVAGEEPFEYTDICVGSWTRNGNSVTIHEEPGDEESDCGGTFTASFTNGNTLTLSGNGATVIYRK
jgi:hypothetical protein